MPRLAPPPIAICTTLALLLGVSSEAPRPDASTRGDAATADPRAEPSPPRNGLTPAGLPFASARSAGRSW